MSLINKGYVMSGDSIVATIENDIVTVTDHKRCPLFLTRISDITLWLADRVLDTTRGHSRTLRRVAQLTTQADAEISMRFYGSTVTDNYWVKTADNIKITYEDVRFTTDQLFLLALKGDSSDLNHNPEDIKSPQFTVPGCLEKGWTLENDVWYLYKNENRVEQFNEMFVSDLSKYLGIKSVKYEPTSSGIKSANFADEYNFEHINGLIGENYADYIATYDAIYNKLGSDAAIDYVRLLYCDAICCGMDRHSKNFGILRNKDTGEFVSMAPNYDFNQSLFGNSIDITPTTTVHTDVLIDDFCKLIKERNVGFFIPEINEDELRLATERTNADEIYDSAVRFVLNRQGLVKECVPQIYRCQHRTKNNCQSL